VTTLTLKSASPFNFKLSGLFKNKTFLMMVFALAVSLLAILSATAAGTTGVALQGAYDQLDDLANGYGKQIMTLMGFVICAVGYFGANSASAVFKFVGYAIFLGAGLGGAITLVGAVV
jgi:hypothetical protein